MIRPLIAVKSCQRDANNGFNKAVRETWAKNAKDVDVRFFMGRAMRLYHYGDEVVLDCPDDYNGLPYKTKAICQWAWDRDYTHAFLLDTDTFVIPERLLSSGFENYDYVGHFNGPRGIPNVVYGKCYSWASGGSGYWLSRKAMQIVKDADPAKLSACPLTNVPCEDVWVGQLLGPLIATNDIIVSHDPRYGEGYDACNYKTEITSHYRSQSAEREFDPEWMRRHYIANCL